MAEPTTPEFDRARRIAEAAGWVSPAQLARIVLAAGGEVRVPAASLASRAPVQLWRSDQPRTGEVILTATIASEADAARGLVARG